MYAGGGALVAALIAAAIVGIVGLLPALLATTLLHPVRVPLTITPASLRLPYADVTIPARGAATRSAIPCNCQPMIGFS